ncbi:MAG: oligoendopeptidase F [Parachlamydiales bacterium]
MAKKRTEIDPGSCWKVEALYPNREAWEADFSRLQKAPPWQGVALYKGRLGEGGATLAKALEAFFGALREIERLATYAHLRHDEDVAHEGHKGDYGRAQLLHHTFAQETAWLEPELIALSQEQLQRYLADPHLAPYRFHLEKMIRLKEHTLSPREEELVALAAQALSTSSQAFGAMTNADFKFGMVADEKGEVHELTQGSYALFLRQPDRTLRKNAFHRLHGQFKSYENTLCELLAGQTQTHLFDARSHRFGSCLEAALKPKKIDTAVYHSLIEAVRSRLPVHHRYMALRKRLLGVDTLRPYDMYVSLGGEPLEKIPYPTAVEWAVESMAILGVDYQTKLRRGLTEERWCDIYENEGKRSGAYSSGCYDSMPYILLNYQGQLNDVSTLAHEAGHSMHSLLSRANQPYHYSQYPIFVAEVASTFNEAFLFRLLLDRAKTPSQRFFLINQRIDDIRATLFRQTMFAEFELKIHEMAEQGRPLTPGLLHTLYRELNNAYFGPEVDMEGIEPEWSRIPHFYYGYYVYQYATGVSAALALAKRVSEGGEEERKSYLTFLSSGGSHFPLDLLKGAGVDLTTPEPVLAALDTFEELVNELELTMIAS